MKMRDTFLLLLYVAHMAAGLPKPNITWDFDQRGRLGHPGRLCGSARITGARLELTPGSSYISEPVPALGLGGFTLVVPELLL